MLTNDHLALHKFMLPRQTFLGLSRVPPHEEGTRGEERMTSLRASAYTRRRLARDATSNVTCPRYPEDTLRNILAEYDQSPETDANRT